MQKIIFIIISKVKWLAIMYVSNRLLSYYLKVKHSD